MTFALCSCGIAVALMHTVVIPLLPILPGQLKVTTADVTWLVTATMLTGAVSAPVFGRLGDLFGRRRVLIVILGLMAAGSVLAALSWSYLSLLIGRCLQGAAFGVIPLGVSLLNDHLPGESSGSGVATMSATLGVGGALGLPMAGFVAQFADWHTPFWIAAAISFIAVALAWRYVPESPIRAHGRFDFWGAFGLAAALTALLLGISQGSSWGWTSTPTVAALAGSVLLLGVWTVHQLRTTAPLVNLRANATPIILLTNIAAVLVGIAMFTGFVLIGQILHAPPSTGYGHGHSLLVASLCIAPTGVAMLVFAPISARLSAARGAHVTLFAGCIVLAVTNAALAFLPQSTAAIIAIVTITSTGTAFAYSAMPTIIMARTPATESAAANSLNAVMRTVGTSTCSAISGALLVAFTTVVDGTTVPSTQAYSTAFITASAAATAATLLAGCLVILHRKQRRPATRVLDTATVIGPASTAADHLGQRAVR